MGSATDFDSELWFSTFKYPSPFHNYVLGKLVVADLASKVIATVGGSLSLLDADDALL